MYRSQRAFIGVKVQLGNSLELVDYHRNSKGKSTVCTLFKALLRVI